jgi:hypothetical protein
LRFAISEANLAHHKHQKIVCAHAVIKQLKERYPKRLCEELGISCKSHLLALIEKENVPLQLPDPRAPDLIGDAFLARYGTDEAEIDLAKLRCSEYVDRIRVGEARNPPEFKWLRVFASRP